MAAQELNMDTPDYCTCCNRKLHKDRIVFLELDQRTDTYHNFGGVPDDKSQGWFPFGPDCAKAEIAKAKNAA